MIEDRKFYYVAFGDSQFGPFNNEELGEWLNIHYNKEETFYIWDSISEEWKPKEEYNSLITSSDENTNKNEYKANEGTIIFLEDEEKYKEKRRFIRLPAGVEIMYIDKDSFKEGWAMKKAITQEISTAGLSFVSEEKVPKGTELIMKIYPIGSDEAITIEGEVKHSGNAPFNNMFEMGIELKEMDTEHRKQLKSFLKTLLF